MDVHLNAAGGFQKDIRRGFAELDLVAAHDIMEIASGAGGLQIQLDHGARAGTCHNAGHAQIFQVGQQFFQAGLAGHALFDLLAAVCPHGMQQFLGFVAVIAGNVLELVLPGQAAAIGIKLRRRVRQAHLAAAGAPELVPDALRVKHQAIHIKNNAFYFRCHSV